MEHIHPSPEIDFTAIGGYRPERWRRREQTMRLYLNIAIYGRGEEDTCAAFFYLIDQDGGDIFNTITFMRMKKTK